MADTDGSPDDPNGWRSLIGAPAEVIRLLAGEPLLLLAMGAAVLLTLLAVFGPDTGQPVAVVLAVVVVVLALLRTFAFRPTPDASPPDAPPGPAANLVDVDRSRVVDTTMDAAGGSGGNVIRGRRSRFRNVTMRSGTADHREHR